MITESKRQASPDTWDKIYSSADFLRYSDDVEVQEPDEDDLIAQIITVMRQAEDATRSRYGHAIRVSHAKSHGLLKGELHIDDHLPDYLRQGLFQDHRWYPIVVRMSQVPGELLDDRKVSTQRGLAMKILGVQGDMLPGHEGEHTQDFLFNTNKVFPATGLRSFLAAFTALETVASAPATLKGMVSATCQQLNARLHEVGMDSPSLDFLGHPPRHPLTESYYTQAPVRFGDFIAKLAVIPTSPRLRALRDEPLLAQDENALRRDVIEYFDQHAAEFDLRVQLCTNLQTMSVENANIEWPESDSPYQKVATLYLPAQKAYTSSRHSCVDEELLFSPAHSLAAHRPLGAIMRARLKVYKVLGNMRRRANECPLGEPHNIAELAK